MRRRWFANIRFGMFYAPETFLSVSISGKQTHDTESKASRYSAKQGSV